MVKAESLEISVEDLGGSTQALAGIVGHAFLAGVQVKHAGVEHDLQLLQRVGGAHKQYSGRPHRCAQSVSNLT